MEYTSKGTTKTTDPAIPDDPHSALASANIFYAGIFLFFSIFSFIIFNTGDKWIGLIVNTSYKNSNKIGTTLAARSSLSLAFWFLIHSIITFGNDNLVDSCRFIYHTTAKVLNVFFVLAFFFISLFLPDKVIEYYINFAMYATGIYLIIQLLFLIDFFHKLNDKWATEENLCGAITTTIIFSVGGLTTLGLCYHFFNFGNCGTNVIIITINIFVSLLIWFGAAILERGSVFTASMVVAYVSYVTSTGLMCDSTSCNRLSANSRNYFFSIISSIFTLVWACYSALSTTYRFGQCDCENCEKEVENADEKFSLSFFHFMFCLASIYLCMLVTSWGKSDEATPWSTSRGSVAKWVNIIVSWVVFVLYTWTLLAPYILSDREFD